MWPFLAQDSPFEELGGAAVVIVIAIASALGGLLKKKKEQKQTEESRPPIPPGARPRRPTVYGPRPAGPAGGSAPGAQGTERRVGEDVRAWQARVAEAARRAAQTRQPVTVRPPVARPAPVPPRREVAPVVTPTPKPVPAPELEPIVFSAEGPARTVNAVGRRVRSLLAEREAVRAAFVMSEIFGPPLGLRDERPE
ncbi:MAG: hypothetical protein PVJ57_08765 [Phycisphaerae bacterium]|jgi:hypothetical protein